MEMNYGELTLHELEHELGTDLLPGTEIMADVGLLHFVKSKSSSARVLVPQPSDNPNDPLNWSPLWKVSCIISTLMSVFVMGFGPLSLAPMFPYFIEEFNHSLADVIQFTGVCILVLGFSNLFWVPISSLFGRRIVLIAATFICMVCNIWRAKAKSYGSFMGACAVNGFAAGPAETIGPTVIADVFFLHDRGKYNTLYFVVYFGSLMVGPIIAGPMADHAGWRSFWWLNVGLCALSVIMLIFMFPESKWHRLHPSDVVETHSRRVSIAHPISGPNGENNEKSGAPNGDEINGLTHIETAALDPSLGAGKPSKTQFLPVQPMDHHTSIWNEFFTPWKLLTFPIVELASFIVSWSASCFLTLNLTQSQNFAAPPYLYSSQTIGFFNFAILIGAFIGLATAGPLSDWVSMKLTIRNKGIREPEMRLLSMIPYVCIMILGNVITAVGYEKKWSWKVIVIIGYTCAGIQVAALPAIASTYAVDSYKPVAGAIFVSITINKNVWGYGFSKFITPWIIKSGYIPPIMTNMTLTTIWCLFGILFWYKGKTFRRWTKNSKVHKA